MATMKLRDIKIGEAIEYNKEVWVVVDRHEQTRGNLRTYWQVKLKNLERGNVFEQRFSPDDIVEKVMLHRQEYEYLYAEADAFIFMHPETYEQVPVSKDSVQEDKRGYLVPNNKYVLLMIEEKVVEVEMPSTVELLVEDAPDAARGDTATSVTKLAKVDTGIEVKVPAHIKKGDRIKIRTSDGEFLGRSN
ncbi:MAG: elongation factor P [Planctomycetota bacterium]|nr:elongation factor P [Planctomycetota bacterium]